MALNLNKSNSDIVLLLLVVIVVVDYVDVVVVCNDNTRIPFNYEVTELRRIIQPAISVPTVVYITIVVTPVVVEPFFSSWLTHN